MSTLSPPKGHKIVFCAQGRTLRVVPGHHVVKVGDSVTFYNLHPKDHARVLIPSEELFGERKIPTIDPGQKSEPLCVAEGANGCYPYAVYDLDTREFGHGSGVPIIIVIPNGDRIRE